jgi:hypothetical protein
MCQPWPFDRHVERCSHLSHAVVAEPSEALHKDRDRHALDYRRFHGANRTTRTALGRLGRSVALKSPAESDPASRHAQSSR